MAERMTMWFDKEGDFLEFAIAEEKGSFKDVGDDVFERVDEKGNIIGFAIFNFTKRSLKEEKIELPVKLKMVPATA